MKSKKIKILLIICICLMSLNSMACKNKGGNAEVLTQNTNDNKDNGVIMQTEENIAEEESIMNVPNTIIDLFDGDTRVWYYIHSRDGLAYDNKVKAVFVSENKKITKIYYNLKSDSCGLKESDFNERPNPFSQRFLLADFDAFSNDEIIEKVKGVYADASIAYDFDINAVYAQDGKVPYDFNRFTSFDSVNLPFDIFHEGELDASGNVYEEETINLFDNASINVYFYFNQSVEVESIDGSFEINGIIEPTTIKSKEYVGIKDCNKNMLVTENTYPLFENIALDFPK